MFLIRVIIVMVIIMIIITLNFRGLQFFLLKWNVFNSNKYLYHYHCEKIKKLIFGR